MAGWTAARQRRRDGTAPMLRPAPLLPVPTRRPGRPRSLARAGYCPAAALVVSWDTVPPDRSFLFPHPADALPPPAAPVLAGAEARLVAMARGPDIVVKPLDEVRYFHAEGKYTRVYLAEEEGLLDSGIAQVHARLPQGVFLRVHRSVVVNLDRVQRVRRDEFGRMYLCLDGRTEKVPVSRTHHHLFRTGFF